MAFWKATILSCFVAPQATHRRLQQPLGNWNHDSGHYWEWWYSSQEDRLYQRSDSQWRVWNSLPVIYQRRHFQSSDIITPDLPVDAVRASISGTATRCRLMNIGTYQAIPVEPPNATSLNDLIARLPANEKWAIDHLDAPLDTHYIANAISAFQCFAVSDASLKDGCGTAAFTLVGPTTNDGSVTGVHRVPGPIGEGNSYRCELSGIYGILLIVRLICELHDITSGSVHVRCDNKSVLKIFNEGYVPNPSFNSFDLVQAVWSMLQCSPLTWTAEWVEGHQDDHGCVLDRFAALNCDMDALAGLHRQNVWFPGYVAPQMEIAHEGWSIWCGDEKLHSPHRDVLYDRIYAPKIIEYWTTSHHLQPSPRLCPEAAPNVDWDATGRLMKTLPLGKRIWCTKHGSENCGVGITLKFWKKQSDDGCPCCGAPEDTTHVLRCTHQEYSLTWDNSMEILDNFFTNSDSPQELRQALSSRLRDWRSRHPFY